MIEGVVNAGLEAVVVLALRGPGGQTRDVEAVIDTGYDGFLTLPPSMVEELGLPFRFRGWAVLANGSVERFNVYAVSALWDGQPRNVEVDAVGVAPLIGTALLDGHSLYVEFEEGGRVVVEAMG